MPVTVELRWRSGEVAVDAPDGVTVGVDVSAPSPTGRRSVVVEVAWSGPDPIEASVRFAAELPGEPWWLIPGAFYGENRLAGCTRIYPRYEAGIVDPTNLVSDHWEFRADRAATPAVFAFGPTGAVALTGTESTALGMTGLGFAYDSIRDVGTVHLRFPFHEAPVTYVGSAVPSPGQVATQPWPAGCAVRLELALYELAPDRHGYAAVLREQHDRSAGNAPLNPWVGIEEAADLAAEGLRRWHYTEPGVLLETVGFDREVTGQDGKPVDRQAMHVGWVSGIPWAYALLRHGVRTGATAEIAAARHVIDFICANLAPSGTFWGVWHREGGWAQSWSPVAGTLHSRTLGEATLFLIRALELAPDRPDWAAAVRSNLDAVVARQRPDGNLGSAHHALTGEVLSWDGAAGLAWVNALAESGDAGYLEAAVRAGGYYAQFVEREFLHGAPEDVDLAPTSEDGYVALMAYLALYRRTGEQRWLSLARCAADWMLTFRYSYNTAFAPGTVLGAYGFASRGADNASPSNQHLHAYGLVCTAELAELSVACGDDHYLERAREALACFRQFIARFDGDFNAYRGMASERYYQTVCFQPKGMLLTLSHAWSVGVLLLACEQALADPALMIDPR